MRYRARPRYVEAFGLPRDGAAAVESGVAAPGAVPDWLPAPAPADWCPDGLVVHTKVGPALARWGSYVVLRDDRTVMVMHAALFESLYEVPRE